MKVALNNSIIYIKPSKALIQHIKNLKTSNDMPKGIRKINSIEDSNSNSDFFKHSHFISDKDREFIKTLDLESITLNENQDVITEKEGPLLDLQDVTWLWKKINEESGGDLYLHELLAASLIVLPENDEIPRSEELDRRCQLLKSRQQNREYKAMTKNVDNVRKPLPEDTVAYQVKQINKQLIAVVQFIFSVLAGFAFGFIGVELLLGNLDFGFRLLLGVICSLVIALAELYFLAKKLNEDLQFEVQTEKKTIHSKIN